MKPNEDESQDDATVIPLVFEPFYLIEHFTLSHCALGELSMMRGLSKNKSSKPLMSFFPNLVSLDMSHNEINNMKTALAGLTDLMNLSSLDLSHNYLTR
jgi:hypothetical protein